jgi:hypothetical protein
MKVLSSHFAAAVVTALIVTACAPLQQAPLVYSSKVTVGLDVSLNVAESQGGAISIGVRTIDSAYVPVAVSKELDKEAGQDAKTIGIKLIEAKYGAGAPSEGSNEDATRAERNRKIDDYFAIQKAADEAAKASAEAEDEIAGLSKLMSQMDSLLQGINTDAARPTQPLPSSPGTATPIQRSQALEIRADEVAKLKADSKLSIASLVRRSDGSYNTEQVVADLKRQLDEKRDARSQLESRLVALKAARQMKSDEAARAKDEAIRVAGLAQTSKTDAMSVYGRFDSNGSADAKTGSGQLLVGKVFSTGLASQNLTEAVKLEAGSRCIANDVDVAKALANDNDRKVFLEALSKMCAANVANTVGSSGK